VEARNTMTKSTCGSICCSIVLAVEAGVEAVQNMRMRVTSFKLQ
jgi:hypothetical protein